MHGCSVDARPIARVTLPPCSVQLRIALCPVLRAPIIAEQGRSA
jgi:hypothetical protein